jgi:uncharacterized protein
MKFLIWLVVIWAAVVWMQRAKKNLLRRARDAAAEHAGGSAQAAGAAPVAEIEQMVQCAQCGIHFPKSEAVQGCGTGMVFCCPEHRELHVLAANIG